VYRRAQSAGARPCLTAFPPRRSSDLLVAACADRRVVTVGYRSEAGREWDAVVEPWAVVVRHGRWYLLCRATDRDAVRTYRVDRRSEEHTSELQSRENLVCRLPREEKY